MHNKFLLQLDQFEFHISHPLQGFLVFFSIKIVSFTFIHSKTKKKKQTKKSSQTLKTGKK